MKKPSTQKEVEQIAASLKIETRAFIGGKFVNAKSGKTIDSINPATGEVVARFAACDETDIDEAIAIANKTFERGVWSKKLPTERKHILLKFADLIEKNFVELSVLEALDSGKPVGEVMGTDLPETIHALRWHAEMADKRYGQVSPSGDDSVGIIMKEPVGVVACIAPWNFPIMTTTWKLAPALAEGNSVILKPASQTTLSILALVSLATEAGIPEGVLQVITGEGASVGKKLALHNDVHAVSFTGSTSVGKKLLEYSAQSNLKKIVLELGGKSPLILLNDVEDLSPVVEAALAASFWNTGQNCTANTRIYVPEARKEEFITCMLKGLAENWKIGHPFDPSNNMGPMISTSHHDKVLEYIEKGIAEGTRLLCGGKSMDGRIYIEPTLFADPKEDSVLLTDEIFGPVSCIIGVKSDEEAIMRANETEYGLQATLFTNDLIKAHKYARMIKAGTVSINKYCEGDITTPFGGLKMSGFGGQDNAEAAHEQYSEIKTIFFNLA